MTSSPTAVATAFIAAENSHDVEAGTSIFHPYAVVRDASGQHSGADEIRAWQEHLRDGNFHVDMGPVEEAGVIAKFAGAIYFDPLASIGVQKAQGEWELTVLDGRIALMMFAFSADTLTRMMAGRAAK